MRTECVVGRKLETGQAEQCIMTHDTCLQRLKHGQVQKAFKYYDRSYCTCNRVRTMGTGSAIPVVSTSTESSILLPPLRLLSSPSPSVLPPLVASPSCIFRRTDANAPSRSPRTVQHMHPLSKTTTCNVFQRHVYV